MQERHELCLLDTRFIFQPRLTVCAFLCAYPMNRSGVELHKGGNCSGLNTTTEEAAAFKHPKSEEKNKKDHQSIIFTRPPRHGEVLTPFHRHEEAALV